MIEIKRVTQSSELEGIKTLQQANLRGLLTPEERDRERFVTAEYTLVCGEGIQGFETGPGHV
jgi:hypothetical protein